VIIAHPVKPPCLVPVLEVVSTQTSAETVEFVDKLMAGIGRSVVHVCKEIEGFDLNWLQSALLREAWALQRDGVASCEDIDKTVRNGLGWRWSFMGPFETIDLNAPERGAKRWMRVSSPSACIEVLTISRGFLERPSACDCYWVASVAIACHALLRTACEYLM
jgi:3-hydroxyacyl-CoA dehydrogenase